MAHLRRVNVHVHDNKKKIDVSLWGRVGEGTCGPSTKVVTGVLGLDPQIVRKV